MNSYYGDIILLPLATAIMECETLIMVISY